MAAAKSSVGGETDPCLALKPQARLSACVAYRGGCVYLYRARPVPMETPRRGLSVFLFVTRVWIAFVIDT